MTIQVTTSDNVRTITLEEGHFDYRCRESFQVAYKNHPKNSEYIIDFKSVRYMDSSALGLLLILRERNGGDGSRIHLINCNSSVKELLKTVKFTNLFDMEKPKLKMPDKLEQEEDALKETFQDLLRRRKRL